MIHPSDLKTHIKGFFAGLLDSFGEISPKVQFVKLPDGKSAIAAVRAGYEQQRVVGPSVHRRKHQIEDAASLADWLIKHAKADATEILVSDSEIVAALAPKDAIGDVVTVPLASHPRWKRWAALLGEEPKIDQRKLHRHILACLADFKAIAIEGGGSLSEGEPLAAQLAKFGAVRQSEVQIEVDDLGFVRFAAAQDKTTVSGKIPPKFKIAVPLFLGVVVDGFEPVYELELFLAVEPAKEKGPPSFALTCPELEVVRRKARLDVVAHLTDLLKAADFLVGVGKYETQVVVAEIAT